MKLQVYAVKDLKVCAYMQPFMQNAKGQALRTFGDTVADKTTMFSKHPEDFELYHIADYDDATGKYVCPDIPELCARAIDFVTPEVNNA